MAVTTRPRGDFGRANWERALSAEHWAPSFARTDGRRHGEGGGGIQMHTSIHVTDLW